MAQFDLSGVKVVDLHGRNRYQAGIALEAALRQSQGHPGLYRIRVIHGSHGGTVLRDLVRTTYAHDPRVLRLIPDGENATILVLRELY